MLSNTELIPSIGSSPTGSEEATAALIPSSGTISSFVTTYAGAGDRLASFIVGALNAGPAAQGMVSVSSFDTTTAVFDPKETVGDTAAVQTEIFTIGSSAYTATQAGPTTIMLEGQTLAAGGSRVSLPAGTASLASDGALVIADGTASTTEGHIPSPSTEDGGVAIVTALSTTLTATYLQVRPSNAFAVDGVALSANGQVLNIGGAEFGVASNGLIMKESHTTMTMSPSYVDQAGSQTTMFAGLSASWTIEQLPAQSLDTVEIAGTILTPGGSALTVAGVILSAVPDGIEVEQSSQTTTVGPSNVTPRVQPSTQQTSPAVTPISHQSGTAATSAAMGNGSSTVSASRLGVLSGVLTLLVTCIAQSLLLS